MNELKVTVDELMALLGHKDVEIFLLQKQVGALTAELDRLAAAAQSKEAVTLTQ